jgi:hypothetical protein
LRYCIAFCALLFALQLTTCQSARSVEEKGTANSGTLKGGVVEVEVTLNDLRDARLAAGRVRKAAANLYDEMTRQEMTMMMNPNVVGTTVIMTPRPVFTGNYLPPRKKWVDESMTEIGPVIKLFKDDVDKAIEEDRRTDVSDKGRKAFDPIRDEVFALVNTSFDRYKELEGLTGGQTYDSMSISSAAKGLDDDMKKLDKSLKQGISILQKEAKASKKLK